MDKFSIAYTNRPGFSMVEITELDEFDEFERYIRLYKDNKGIIWGFERLLEESRMLTKSDVSKILHKYPNVFGDENSGADA